MTATRCPDERPDCVLDDPDYDDDEPQDDDLVTTDHRNYYAHGSTKRAPVLTIDEDDDHDAAIRAHMDREQYWPSVWWISDHGNAHRVKIEPKP